MRKAIRFLDWVTDRILMILFLICFIIGLYGLYDSYMIYLSTTDKSLLRYKPGYSSGEEPDREIQGNMVAWVTLDDTCVDYPIMQGVDNTYYLSKDPYGDYSLAGSIFLDARNRPDFSDVYSLVYGHHMEGGLMFGSLDEYLEESYFHSHNKGTLTVDGKTYELSVFAVVETNAMKKEIFSPTEVDPEDVLEFIRRNATYFDTALEPDLDGGAHILGLSTCKYPATTDRTIVMCAYR